MPSVPNGRHIVPQIRTRTGKWITPASAELVAEHVRRHPCGAPLVPFDCPCGGGGWVEVCPDCKTVVVSHSPKGYPVCACVRAVVA